MNKILGISIIGILVVVSAIFLIIYYTQDFTPNIIIKDTISTSELITQTQVPYTYGKEVPGQTYISSVRANIGTLKLENEGIFPVKYNFPQYLLCIDNLPDKGITSRNVYGSEGNVYFYIGSDNQQNHYGNQMREPVEVSVHESHMYSIGAEYYLPASTFYTSESFAGNTFSLYEIPHKENNPLSTEYLFANYGCDDVSSLKFIKKVSIVT